MYDGTEARLYVDGALVDTHPRTGRLVYDGSPLWVGSDFNRGSNVLHFEGDMDDLRIYARPLSEAEIGVLASGR